MDIMNDDELMGIIGHEIGHVVKRHSKNAFRTQLLTGAMKDAVASTGGKAAALTESQLGTLGEALINSNTPRSRRMRPTIADTISSCSMAATLRHGHVVREVP